jgi:lipoyl(octanoyl) transferase
MIEWRHSHNLVDYEDAVTQMHQRALDIYSGNAPELVWLLEHPPLITTGARTDPEHLRPHIPFPTYTTGRGGEATYHGPGQRVIYLQLNLKHRGQDVRKFVHNLESWLIASLALLQVTAVQRPGRIGLWIPTRAPEAKIAAIGIRVQKWVTLHGASLNVAPDLSHFNYITPCGLQNYGVTSLADLGLNTSLETVDDALETTFPKYFVTEKPDT